MTLLNSLEMKLFPNLEAAYSQQLSNADYEPSLLETHMKINSKSSLNNLPRAEFEDTGLVGREVEVQKVMDLITNGRDHIVSIVGEGGLGKTAIALEVGHRLAESRIFDLIVWSSLKEEKLTATGLTSIHNAVQGIYGVEGAIEQFVLETFNEAVETLAESLSGLRVLLVIDNIETVSGNEIIELYDKFSGTVQFLLTSRVGLGQLERRYELKRLSEKAGRHLFRVLVRFRSVTQLAQLTDEEVDDVLDKLRYSPLAIRWFVMSIEAGRTIKDVLSHQDDLLTFCVGNVVDALSEHATRLLALLHYLKRPLSFEYVAVFGESILSADNIRRAIQELINSSMIVIERNDEGSLSELFRCTPTVTAYLDLHPIEVANQEEITQRDRQFRKNEEQRRNRSRNQDNYWNPLTIRTRNDNDAPLASLLNIAQGYVRGNQLDDALALVQRVRAIDATYFETERIASNIYGQMSKPHESNLRAIDYLRIAPLEHRPFANYVIAETFWRMNDLDKAYEHAKAAYQESHRDPHCAAQVARILTYSEQFVDAEHYAKEALRTENQVLNEQAYIVLVTLYHRWAEYFLQKRELPKASEIALKGLTAAVDSEGSARSRCKPRFLDCFIDLLQSQNFNSAVKGESLQLLISDITPILKVSNFEPELMSHRQKEILRAELIRSKAKVESSGFQFPSFLDSLITQGDGLTPQAGGSEYLGGTVYTIHDHYGFIKHELFPSNIYFKTSLLDPTEAISLRTGQLVKFTINEDVAVEEGSAPRALSVKFQSE